MLGKKTEPDKLLKAELTELADSIEAYMDMLATQNALPALRGKAPLPIDNPDVRLRVRKAIDAIIMDEGELVGKPFEQKLFFLENAIAGQEDVLGYNPYRDTSLSLLLVLNQFDHLQAVYQQQFPESKIVNKLIKPLHKSIPVAIMLLFDEGLTQPVQSAFPATGHLFNQARNAA